MGHLAEDASTTEIEFLRQQYMVNCKSLYCGGMGWDDGGAPVVVVVEEEEKGGGMKGSSLE